jgi:hypothetical protein
MFRNDAFRGTRRRIALTLVAAILGVTAAAFAGEEEGEAAFCEKTVMRCFADAVASGFMTLGAALLPHLSFCLIGYSFCERFVEPLLHLY